MKYIKDTPGKFSWKATVWGGDSDLVAHSGWVGDLDRSREWARGPYEEFGNRRQVPNFVFEATFYPNDYNRGRSSVTLVMSDMDTGVTYELGPQAIFLFVQAVSSGQIERQKDGGFKGYFTFKKQGGSVYVMPYTDDELEKQFKLPPPFKPKQGRKMEL